MTATLVARWRRWAVGPDLAGYVDLGPDDLSALEAQLFYNDALATREPTAVLLRRYLDAHTAAWLASDNCPCPEFLDHERRDRELAALTPQERRQREDRVFAAVLAEADAAATLIRRLSEGEAPPRPWRARGWARRYRRARGLLARARHALRHRLWGGCPRCAAWSRAPIAGGDDPF